MYSANKFKIAYIFKDMLAVQGGAGRLPNSDKTDKGGGGG